MLVVHSGKHARKNLTTTSSIRGWIIYAKKNVARTELTIFLNTGIKEERDLLLNRTQIFSGGFILLPPRGYRQLAASPHFQPCLLYTSNQWVVEKGEDPEVDSKTR